MKLIEQNPFRMLGIAANASEKEKAANLGKKRLLDIGREVTFPLDLPSLLSPIARTSEAMSNAEKAINLPQDKVRYALYWFAQPSDPVGKLAYEHLLQGNIEKATELFGRSSSWEAKLCLSVLNLQARRYGDAMLMLWELSLSCAEFCTAICGQTFTMNDEDLTKLYIETLAKEVDIVELYSSWGKGHDGLPGGSEIIQFTLRDMASDLSTNAIENSIASAKSVDSKNASAQLAAGKKLVTNTKRPLSQLKQIASSGDPRVNRLCDKLAGQIFQCSVNYHNAIDNSTDEPVGAVVIDECLKLARYAQSIAIGKMTRDRIQNGIDTLEEKKSKLPPAGVEKETATIAQALRKFVALPDKIIHSVILINETKPHLQNIKSILGATHPFYIQLSSQIVGNALHNCVAEVNTAQEEEVVDIGGTKYRLSDDKTKTAVRAAWNCTKMLDTFDMDTSTRSHFDTNKNALRSMCSQLGISTSPRLSAGVAHSNKTTTSTTRTNTHSSSSSSTYSSKSSSSGDSDTNWGCIIWGIIGFIILCIILAN